MHTSGHRPNSRSGSSQGGFSTATAVGALIVLGIVFLSIFMLSTTSKPPTNSGTEQQNQQTENQETSNSNEPPFIRIPENSEIYRNEQYKFSFAYPDSFGKLTASKAVSSTVVFAAESALAANKPIGGGSAAFLNGHFGVYVYKKDDFKILIRRPDISVAPTKTGNDTTWKLVSIGNTTQDISIGDAYAVTRVNSQTGVPVFDFALKESTNILGRWVFEAGDYYILVALPTVSKPSNTPLSSQDIAAYNIIGNNIARTTRVTIEPTVTTTGDENSNDSNNAENTTN